MTKERLWHTFRLWTMIKSTDRVAYLRKHHVFAGIGKNVTITDRKVPLYANLVKIHDNVKIASNVTFVTHDITHFMLNKRAGGEKPKHLEQVGCIEIMDNVFVGTNVSVLSNVRIGPNAIVAAGAVVTKDVPANSVVGGVPARFICSLDDYLAKRTEQYPEELAPKHQKVSKELADYLWETFENDRK